MLEKNILAPYRFIHQNTVFHFCFNYGKVEDCLPQILQLHRAASLITVQQNAMVKIFLIIKNKNNHYENTHSDTSFNFKDYGYCTL